MEKPMVETQRERQLFLMILNISSAIGEIQQALLALADSPAIGDEQKAEVLRHNAATAVQFNELLARLKEYQAF